MSTCFALGCDTFVGCGLHETILVLYYMKVCLCYIIYLYVCTNENEDVYTLYVYMQTCCWLQEVQVGVMHYIIHFLIKFCLHCS